MKRGELAEVARQLVERTTAAQGLPAVIEDETALRRVAGIVSESMRESTPVARRGRSNNVRSGRSRSRRTEPADA